MSVSFLQPTRQPPAVVLDQEPDEATRRDRPARVLLLNDDFTPSDSSPVPPRHTTAHGRCDSVWTELIAYGTRNG